VIASGLTVPGLPKCGALQRTVTRSPPGQDSRAPAGASFVHFNLATAVTDDVDLLVRHGAELLAETARMWGVLGYFSDRHDGRFVIHEVTGPDE
jgi:hypothetical protein